MDKLSKTWLHPDGSANHGDLSGRRETPPAADEYERLVHKDQACIGREFPARNPRLAFKGS